MKYGDPFAMVCPACGGEFRQLAYLHRCPLCLTRLAVDKEGRPRRRRTLRGRRPGKLRAVAERDGWVCHLCGREVFAGEPPNSPGFATLDHVVPRSKGGTMAKSNLKLAHYSCNTERGNTDLGGDEND